MPGRTVKYAEVREQLLARISTMSTGDRLPPEPELCAHYGVSRITLRRAVEDLINNGLLIRQQGRGTFVTEPQYPQHFHETFAERVKGFYRQQVETGHTVTTKVLGNQVTRKALAAERLGLAADAELVELERLRWVNGTLHQHSTTWLSAGRFPRALTHDFAQGSLFEFLENCYAVRLSRNDLVVAVGRADLVVARALNIIEHDPIMVINSTVYTVDDEPVTYGITNVTPDNSEISISMRFTPNM